MCSILTVLFLSNTCWCLQCKAPSKIHPYPLSHSSNTYCHVMVQIVFLAHGYWLSAKFYSIGSYMYIQLCWPYTFMQIPKKTGPGTGCEPITCMGFPEVRSHEPLSPGEGVVEVLLRRVVLVHRPPVVLTHEGEQAGPLVLPHGGLACGVQNKHKQKRKRYLHSLQASRRRGALGWGWLGGSNPVAQTFVKNKQ